MDPPLWAREQIPEYRMKTLDIPYQKKVHISANSRKSDAHTFLGFSRTSPWAISERVSINSMHYSEMPFDRLKLVIQNKRQGKLSQSVVLLCDSAWPHTVACTVQTLQQLHSEIPEHLSYDPDLDLPDCHSFWPLICALKCCHFATNHKLKETVHIWLVTQLKTFFSEGIERILHCWTKCVEKQGSVLKIIHFQVLYCYGNFNNYTEDTFWYT